MNIETPAGTCPLCRAIEAGPVIDGGLAVAIADGFPLSPGHHLVLSRRHEPDFFALTPDEVAAVMRVAFELQPRLNAEFHPDGFNVGVNVGDAGGQTVGHVHLHVIPRYRGDVPEPKGGIRWLIPERAVYWESGTATEGEAATGPANAPAQ